MFGEVALPLLRMMGHSDTVPGAILAEDAQPALERLEAALASETPPPKQEMSSDWDDEEPAISLSDRALPLIEMFRAAVRENCNVMWDSNKTDA